jgi:hypothetical protein
MPVNEPGVAGAAPRPSLLFGASTGVRGWMPMDVAGAAQRLAAVVFIAVACGASVVGHMRKCGWHGLTRRRHHCSSVTDCRASRTRPGMQVTQHSLSPLLNAGICVGARMAM